MIKAQIKRGDGLASGRQWLESVVRNMQLALVDAELLASADGKFGAGTEKQLIRFQRSHDLLNNPGLADKQTWRHLQPHLDNTVGKHEAKFREFLQSFRGDLEWIHAREGHLGKPYWPGGASGVTLDPGVDLGHVPLERVAELYRGILGSRELKLLAEVDGIKGQDARTALNSVPGLLDIRISREQAGAVFPFAAQPYWNKISKRMKGLRRQDTPPSVQTVLLSLAYNRGAFNRNLAPLITLIAERQWRDLADRISGMQQNHSLKGIRIRRRHEAALVMAELNFLGLT